MSGKTFEVTVRDAGGFTFVFDYRAKSKIEAISIFKKRCRAVGIHKFKYIKILSVVEV